MKTEERNDLQARFKRGALADGEKSRGRPTNFFLYCCDVLLTAGEPEERLWPTQQEGISSCESKITDYNPVQAN